VIAEILATGEAFFTGSNWNGHRVMRVSVCNWQTTERDVERAVQAVETQNAVSDQVMELKLLIMTTREDILKIGNDRELIGRELRFNPGLAEQIRQSQDEKRAEREKDLRI